MIKDKDTIRMAIAEIVGEESYIRLRAEDFAEVCPNPAWAVHVTGKDTDDLLRQLNRQMAGNCTEPSLISGPHSPHPSRCRISPESTQCCPVLYAAGKELLSYRTVPEPKSGSLRTRV